MAYKKFIKKNGKIYGPYLYHSKRINGKVISEYKGMETEKKWIPRKTIVISTIATISLAIILILLLSPQFTGEVIGKIVPPQNEESITSQFNLILREGEFIPSNSIISIQKDNITYNFTIEELYLEELQTNEFYLENENLTGSGKGLGVPGKKEIIIPVYFDLELIENSSDSENIENQTTEELENSTQETVELENTTEEYPETSIEEESVEEVEDVAQIQTTQNNEQTSLITGNVVLENKISGEVKKGENFTYQISENQNVKLIPGSIKTKDNQLSDNQITIKKENNLVLISTNYSEFEEGFGPDYIGQEQEIQLNFKELNFSLNDSVNIKIIYQNTTLYQSEQLIEENNFSLPEENITENLNQTPINETEENITLIENETIISELIIEYENLTETEKEILRNEFKMIVLNSTAYEYKDKILVNSQIGTYELSNVYSQSISEEKLKEIIKKDQIAWLKDIAKELSKNNSNLTRREDFDSVYSEF